MTMAATMLTVIATSLANAITKIVIAAAITSAASMSVREMSAKVEAASRMNDARKMNP